MKFVSSRVIAAGLGMLMLTTMTGCFGVELGTMKPGKMEWVATNTTEPRAGHAYLIRGLIGLFSYGIDRMTDKINAAGIKADVFQEDQTAELGKTIVARYKANRYNHEPIILCGHSLGADDAILISKMLNKENIPVDMLITIDATHAPTVPGNVKVCYNYYQPSIFDGTGMLRGMPLTLEPGAKTVLYNFNIRGERKDLLEWDTNHVNIDKNTKIHADAIAHIMTVCPTRAEWVAAHGGASGLALSPAHAASTQPSPVQTISNSTASGY